MQTPKLDLKLSRGYHSSSALFRFVWSAGVRNKQQADPSSTGGNLEEPESIFDLLWFI